MLHRACEPTHPVPTSQDTSQATNDSILQTQPHPTSQDTPLKISMFTLQAAKLSSLARKHGRMKTCVRPSGQKIVLSKLQWLKLPVPNLLQKCSQEEFPRLKSFGFMVYLCGWNSRPTLEIEKCNKFSFGVEKNSMAPAHSFVAAWPPLPRMTRTNPLDIHGSRKIGAVQLTGAVPVPSHI